jgi:AcrR family transcriptional regulator
MQKQAKEKYALREIKQAKLKLAIMGVFVKKLHHLRFDAICIKEVCRKLEISEGTFFNYFPEKIDVISYYVALTTLKIIYEISTISPPKKHIDFINSIFDKMADEFCTQNMANLTYEIISIVILQHEKPGKVTVSNLEKILAFPGLNGIEKVEALMIDEFLLKAVKQAIAGKEIKKKVVAQDVLVALIAIMVGTLIAIKFEKNLSLKTYYRRHLKMLWNELAIY